jgi:magnesium-transporting ATPase (P-type)
MQVRELLLGQRRYAVGEVEPALADRHRDFFLGARLCHDLKETSGNPNRFVGDPMEVALAEVAASVLPELKVSRRLDEIPFDSDPFGPVLYCKGAPEVVLPLCLSVADGDETLALDSTDLHRISDAQGEMAEKGLRVLALASRSLPNPFARDDLEQALVFQGLVGLEDPPRPEVPAAVRTERESKSSW